MSIMLKGGGCYRCAGGRKCHRIPISSFLLELVPMMEVINNYRTHLLCAHFYGRKSKQLIELNFTDRSEKCFFPPLLNLPIHASVQVCGVNEDMTIKIKPIHGRNGLPRSLFVSAKLFS